MKWLEYYKGKTVLVTGHTGFKGSWLCVMLEMAGAKVVGYALPPEKDAVLFDCSGVAERMVSVEGDIRDRAHLLEVFHTYQPQVVFHLAAQPIVRTSYEQPVYTYETNVMGTVNLLECVRNTPGVQSVLNVTTDKVYENKEWEWGYRENDPLDGFDPYSNSKSCSELVTHSYKKSFLDEKGIAVSTARAGNVIGGGDFNKDLLSGGSEAYFGVSTADYNWAQPVRFDLIDETDIRLIAPEGKNAPVPSVRNADGAYHEGQLVLTVDGFLVSPNVEVTGSEVLDTGFAYSDHNPIIMTVKLRDAA